MHTPDQIWKRKRAFPRWLPREFNDRQRAMVAPFTPGADGWLRWYRGKTIRVAPASLPLDQLDAAWTRKKAEADARTATTASTATRSTSMTLEQYASAFYAFNDDRVATGRPKRLAKVTAWDYTRVINAFGRVVGPDTLLDDLGPAHFSKYAQVIRGEAATTWNRHIAYIEAWVRWGLERGLWRNNVQVRGIAIGQDPLRTIVGPDLVKLPAQDLRDSRLRKTKSFSPDEIRKLWAVAGDDTMRLMIGLGICGALDNADVAQLTRDVIDLQNGIVDYRRRKSGRVRRVIPLPAELTTLLRAYRRPEPSRPEYGEFFFLTEGGQPLSAMGESGPTCRLATRFTRLMEKAGLRPRGVTRRVTGTNQRKLEYPGGRKSDGRGFRSLRTTFPNLAPPGYRDEVEVVMGHSQGSVLADSYLELHGLGRLRELTAHVWHRAFACPSPMGEVCSCAGTKTEKKVSKKGRRAPGSRAQSRRAAAQ